MPPAPEALRLNLPARPDEPEVREYWVQAGQKIELGKVWRSSSCEHRWRVVSAEYY